MDTIETLHMVGCHLTWRYCSIYHLYFVLNYHLPYIYFKWTIILSSFRLSLAFNHSFLWFVLSKSLSRVGNWEADRELNPPKVPFWCSRPLAQSCGEPKPHRKTSEGRTPWGGDPVPADSVPMGSVGLLPARWAEGRWAPLLYCRESVVLNEVLHQILSLKDNIVTSNHRAIIKIKKKLNLSKLNYRHYLRNASLDRRQFPTLWTELKLIKCLIYFFMILLAFDIFIFANKYSYTENSVD